MWSKVCADGELDLGTGFSLHVWNSSGVGTELLAKVMMRSFYSSQRL